MNGANIEALKLMQSCKIWIKLKSFFISEAGLSKSTATINLIVIFLRKQIEFEDNVKKRTLFLITILSKNWPGHFSYYSSFRTRVRLRSNEFGRRTRLHWPAPCPEGNTEFEASRKGYPKKNKDIEKPMRLF